MDEMTVNILTEIIKVKGNEFGQYLAEAQKRALGIDQETAGSAHPVTIDYSQSLNQMIKAGHYNFANFSINERNFPYERSSGLAGFKIELIHFNRNIGSDEAIKELDKMGLRPATLAELLALGAQHPDLQRQFPIVVLNSVWQRPFGLRYVPYLWDDSDKRNLNLNWFDDDWNASYRFAAVHNSLYSPMFLHRSFFYQTPLPAAQHSADFIEA